MMLVVRRLWLLQLTSVLYSAVLFCQGVGFLCCFTVVWLLGQLVCIPREEENQEEEGTAPAAPDEDPSTLCPPETGAASGAGAASGSHILLTVGLVSCQWMQWDA